MTIEIARTKPNYAEFIKCTKLSLSWNKIIAITVSYISAWRADSDPERPVLLIRIAQTEAARTKLVRACQIMIRALSGAVWPDDRLAE